MNLKKTITFAYLLLFVCVSVQSIAQNEPVRFEFLFNKQKKATLKFELINNLIIVPVSINDSDTLKFILDTGLKNSIITSLPTNDSILLNFAETKKIKGLGTDDDLEVISSYGNKLQIGSIIGYNLAFFVLTENRFNLTSELGMEINGLLGADIFENFVVEINYSSKRITFHSQKNFKYKKKYLRRCSYPLEIHHSKPYITLPVVTENKDTFSLKLLIDTGSSDALWIFANSNTGVKAPKLKRYTLLGKGLNGDIHGFQSRINQLLMCNKSLKSVATSYPDTNAIVQTKQLDIIGRNGSVGAELMRRFDVIFDYKNNKITLRPNQYYKTPFNYNMSGIILKQPYENLPVFVITKVLDNSPASKVGIIDGDQLITINGRSAISLSLPEINSLFRLKPNKKMKLKILRNGKLIKKQFRLIKDI